MNWIDQLPESPRQALEEIASTRRFTTGELVFGLSDNPDGIFLIHRGSATVYLGCSDGRQLILRICRPGDLFGQTASIDGSPAPVFVEARSTLTTSFFPYQPLQHLRIRHAEIANGLARQAAQTIRGLMDTVAELTFMPLPERALAHLRRLVVRADEREEWPEVEITQAELASMLASSRPGLNQALQQLEQEGLIRRRFRHIAVRRLPSSSPPGGSILERTEG